MQVRNSQRITSAAEEEEILTSAKIAFSAQNYFVIQSWDYREKSD